MPSGRLPKPHALKVLQGTAVKCRERKDEARFPAFAKYPAPQKTLNKYGKELWNRLVKDLVDSGVLTTPDLPAFEDMCERYGYAKKLRDTMGDDLSEFLDTKNAKNKYIAYKTEMAAVWVMMASYGLTPSARNKFGVGKKDDEPDEYDKTAIRLLKD